MRNKTVALILLAAMFVIHGCTNTPSSEGMPFVPDLYSVWQYPGIFGEFEVLSDTSWELTPPNSTDVLRGRAYRLRVVRYLPSRQTHSVLHPEIGSEIVAIRLMGTIPYPFDGGAGTARLVPGHRFLIYSGFTPVRSDIKPFLDLQMAWVIDSSRSVTLEPCLGFPAGTPIARLMDDTSFRYCAGLSIDGGVTPDAYSCPAREDTSWMDVTFIRRDIVGE